MGIVCDEEHFSRLVKGDREALRPLMERYGEPVKLYVDGYIHDADMAEEIMIDAVSRMLVKAPRLREGAFKPYLYKTARNLAFKHLKYRSRFMSLDTLAYEPVDEARFEEGLVEDERNRELYRNLDRIPPEYREALYLVYIEGLSYDEAGAVMRKSRKQLENLLLRGKRAMRSLMETESSDASVSAPLPADISFAALGGDEA